MRISRLLPAILLLCVLWVIPDSASMQPSPCIINLPCNGGGSQSLNGIIINMIFSSGAKNTFGALLALYFFIYGMRLILLGERSDVVQETKMAYAYGVTGSALYIFADSIIASVGTGSGGINTAPAASALQSIITYMNAIMGALLLYIITYQAIKIIIKRGDESAMEEARKRFVFIIMGIVVYVLANAIVTWAMPGAGSTRFVSEIVGMIRYMLEIIGVLTVLAFIFAGFLYVISVNESSTDRAKKAMKNTAIALIVILFSYTIVSLAANGFKLQ